jgi:DNA-binding response OmpR family regulator
MSRRILLVDDEPGIVEFVTYGLAREGFEVVSVGDGQDALERARAEPFDLMVLDVMLPRLSGMDVARAVRRESDLPIVMLTARDAETDLVVGLESGADDYVTKPFSMVDGRAVRLTRSEFRILTLLSEQPGRVYSRREILQHLWSTPHVPDERTADAHVANLRRKLGEEGLIVTVRGAGYKLVA